MASGERWQDHINKAAACPAEWPFGTKFRYRGRVWECLDRGGKIVVEDGIPWVDLLTDIPPVPYGTIEEIEVLR